MSMQTASSPVRPLAVGRKTTVTVPPDEPLIIIRRTFPAPARLVFAALTQPEHVRQWYGCESMTMPTCEIDLKVGGSFRYELADAEGNVFGWSGTYLELDPPHGMSAPSGSTASPTRWRPSRCGWSRRAATRR